MELAPLSMPLSCKTFVNQFGNKEEVGIPLEESKFHDFNIQSRVYHLINNQKTI